MTKVDENIQTAQNMLSGIVERIKQLEEENKKLKELKCIPTNLKTVIRIDEENAKLKEEVEVWKNANKKLRMHDAKMEYENKKLKETIKDHQLYEEKLEHRIIEFEELLHGE